MSVVFKTCLCSDCVPVRAQSVLEVPHVHCRRLWHACTIAQKCHARKKRNTLLPIFSFGQPKLQIGNLPILKISQKKLKIGNNFLVFLPFPGHKFQNLNTMGICETQFLEAF